MLEVRAVREDELEAAGLCIGRAFREDAEGIRGMAEYFRDGLRGDTIYTLENTRVAVLDGRVVSVVQIHDRRMLMRGTPVRQAYVPLVGTDPEHRGRGYGALLLRDAAEYIEREGYAVSLIQTEGAERFYERGGWSEFGHYHKLTLRLPGDGPLSSPGYEIVPFDPERDLDAVLGLFESSNRAVSGPAVRTRAFWKTYARGWEFPYPIFVLARSAGEAVAYLRDGHGRRIVEIGWAPGREEAAWALILRACREARDAGLAEVEAVGLDAFRERLGAAGFGAERERVGGHMYRVHNLPLLLEALLPRMQEGWTASALVGWEGSVLVEGEDGSAVVVAGRGRLAVLPSPPERPSVRVRVTRAQLVELLFGQADPRRFLLAPAGDPGTAATVVEALFPRHPYRWWPKDAI